MVTVTVPKVQQLGKIKTPKGKKEEQPVHVDCKSPQSCKKCRIMRRMGKKHQITKHFSEFFLVGHSTVSARVALKPRKLNRNKIKEVDSANQNVGKTEHSKPEYSDISDTETKTDGPVTYDKNQAPVGLPYSDHEYSRISFYGCGVGEETLNAQEKPPAQNIETSGTNNITKFVPQIVPPKIASIFFAKHNTNANCSLLKPRPMPAPQPRLAQAQQPRPVPALQPIVYHFKPNNGLRQPSPANFVQNANTTSLLANNWRTDVCNTSMIRPVSYANQSIFVNSPMPVNFAAPVIQRPIVRQPVLFVCETSKQQFPTQFPTH